MTSPAANPIEELYQCGQYRFVDQMLELSEDAICTAFTVPSDTFYSQGHFPGLPVMPGALLGECCYQAACLYVTLKKYPADYYNFPKEDRPWALGVLTRVESMKLRSFVRPGDQLVIHARYVEELAGMFRFRAFIERVSGDAPPEKVMSCQFWNTNLSISTFSGSTVQ